VAAVSSAPARFLAYVIHTSHPLAASSCAVAAPMPELAPVINALRVFKSVGGSA
jgi:hypothetical protein